jgi:hypothetical protein
MSEVLADPFLRIPLIAFAVSAAVCGLLRLVGGARIGPRLAGGGLGVGALIGFVAAAGLPPVPPAVPADAVFYVAAAGIALGLPLDGLAARWEWTAAAIAAVVAAAVWWHLGAPAAFPGLRWLLLWAVPAAAVWLVILFRLQVVAVRPPTAPLLMLLAALGLAAVAAITGATASTLLALALAAATLGFLAWTWPVPRFPFGTAAVLAGGGSLLALAARLMMEGGAAAVAVLVAGLALFADTGVPALPTRREWLRRLAEPLILAGAGLVPVLLAAAVAYVGLHL